jgi:hypothetical protein
VSEMSKPMGTQILAWKKRRKMNNIALVLLQKYFQVLKEK